MLNSKVAFIIKQVIILALILVGVIFVVSCINMPVNQGTNEIARIVFSSIVIIAPLAFFAMIVRDEVKLKNKYGW